MAVIIGSARSDERGKITGGAAGDQNKGKEVSTQNWYKHSKGWVVIRAKDAAVREKIAVAMQAACDNNNIGYDQTNRNGLFNNVKNKGFDPAKCTVKTETDCSATVRVCVHYAGIKCNDFTTLNEASVLKATGKFEVITAASVCNYSTNLMRGDILCTKTKGHTVVVLTNGANIKPEPAKPTNPGTVTIPNNKKIEIAQPTLKKGSKGQQVKYLQHDLNYAMGSKLVVDGEFGTATFNTLKSFQKKYGLTQDGIYGQNSYKKMKDVFGV